MKTRHVALVALVLSASALFILDRSRDAAPNPAHSSRDTPASTPLPAFGASAPQQSIALPLADAPAEEDDGSRLQSPQLAPRPLSSAKSLEPEPKPMQAKPPGAPRRQKPPLSPFAQAARAALTYVGADAAAEEFWNNAINDATLDPDTRKDLIEDLNETGFDDPGNLSPADLPLIENRLALIEDLAPFAMDSVNYDAFLEAYKDLLNMHAKVVGGP